MKKASLAAALTLVIFLAGGCGTISNFSGKGWGNTHIYGGVQRDIKSVDDWLTYRPITSETEWPHDVGTVVGTGLIALDVPLSAIGDTLTLPITIPAAIWGTRSGEEAVSRKDPRMASGAPSK